MGLGLLGFMDLGLVGLIGLGRVGLIGQISLIDQISLVRLISHIIGLIGLNGFSLIGLVGFSGIDNYNLAKLIGHISLVGLICISGWLARARKKMWWWIASFGYSNHNDVFPYRLAAALQATVAKTHEIAIKLASATKITNAAIWYYCAALLVLLSFICEGESVVTCAFYCRLNSLFSLFFGDALQNAKQLFSTRIPQMTKYCVMRECENILHGYLYVLGLAFVILKGIYGFKSPKRFLEISSRDFTSSLLFCQS
jgi:hypothetical protein